MTTRRRGYLLGAVVALIAAWTGLQFWLTHKAIASFNAQITTGPHPAPAWPTSVWVQGGIESVVGLGLLVALAAVLARGGRGWWSLVVAAFPAATVIGRFTDGASIGVGWQQPTDTAQTWFTVGTVADTVTLLGIAALLVLAIPARRTTPLSRSTLVRSAVLAALVVGWWFMRTPSPDGASEIWVVQAVIWVFVVAVVTTSSLAPALLVATLAGLLPLFSATLLTDLLAYSGHHFDVSRYLHHLAVAAGVTAYVLVGLAISRRISRDAPIPAPAA